ncbi:hypothetical protein K445DRAFT_314461, partial [Daldinia sp. EC12]
MSSGILSRTRQDLRQQPHPDAERPSSRLFESTRQQGFVPVLEIVEPPMIICANVQLSRSRRLINQQDRL